MQQLSTSSRRIFSLLAPTSWPHRPTQPFKVHLSLNLANQTRIRLCHLGAEIHILETWWSDSRQDARSWDEKLERYHLAS